MEQGYLNNQNNAFNVQSNPMSGYNASNNSEYRRKQEITNRQLITAKNPYQETGNTTPQFQDPSGLGTVLNAGQSMTNVMDPLAPVETASQNLNPGLFSSSVVDPLFNPEKRLEDSMMS
tara:strand:+ start:676 stop:1032 length:357 start_codon:yes stop_codon:yes gene_type:complete